ncbi:MAG: hypothetical protein F4089_10395 [Gammaproteobacteria bacterium]|nr:hypothetical protein [Gammaproteobacteria bacterium]
MTKRLAIPALVLVSCSVAAQEETRAPQTVASGNGPVMVLPLLETTGPGSMIAGGIRLEMGVEEGFRVYRAHQDGHTRTVYEPVDSPAKRYAYDPAQRRFDPVSSTLRVRLADYERLGEVVASVGGSGAKHYPALGFALLRLPSEANPATAARTLADDPLVVKVEVVLEEPIRVPQ